MCNCRDRKVAEAAAVTQPTAETVVATVTTRKTSGPRAGTATGDTTPSETNTEEID